MADDEEESDFLGTWRIEECVSLTGQIEQTGIEGTQFTLDKSGEVTWKVTENSEPMPFFSCETFEVSDAGSDYSCLKLCGTFGENVIEFKAEVSEDQKLMLLTYERCCMLQCQKVRDLEYSNSEPFSFLEALNEGYFCDLCIKANSGKKFNVHKTILSVGYPEVQWLSQPLDGLPESVVKTTLHYCYSECLPEDMSDATARECVQCLKTKAGFSAFLEMCDTFFKNIALKQQFISLVSDIHSGFDKVIDMCTDKGPLDDSGTRLMSNPARLCYVAKQAVREASLGGVKLVLLCDMYSKRKGELSREERHELMKYAKSRVPILLGQLQKLIEVCNKHLGGLSPAQRHEIAAYLVPEIDKGLEEIGKFITDAQFALEDLIKFSTTEKESEGKHKDKPKKGNIKEALGKTIRNALHVRELMKLKKIHEDAAVTYNHLMQKRDQFSVLTQDNKVRTIAKNLESFQEEVPIIWIRLEELISALDSKVTWRDWKYLFKFGVSKVAWGLSKAKEHKSVIQSVLHQACDMIQVDQFTSCLNMLGLIDSSTVGNASLSAIESLCVSPSAKDSLLTKRTLNLLHNSQHTDMAFEVICVQESGDVVVDHTHGDTITRTDHSKEVDITEIKAHRVIVAARCQWFKKALLSGMRESIERKITVHDTSAHLFGLFLEYLYTGHLDCNLLSVEQLSDIMAMADRYEMDNLKSLCERKLVHQISDDCCLFLLGIADQYTGTSLRKATLDYIAENSDIVDCDSYSQLPKHLQTDVDDAVMWDGLEPRPGISDYHFRRARYDTASSGSGSSYGEIDLTTRLGATGITNHEELDSSSSSDEDDPGSCDSNSAHLQVCISALRNIVGDEADTNDLVRVILAADYDINRAANFYFEEGV